MTDSLTTLQDNLSSPWWRLNNLYYIKDKKGKKIKFRANWAQAQLYESMWYLNIILKARQLGMTTLIQLFILDRCIFNDNVNGGVIAHNREDAQKFFKDKIKFAYDNLPIQIKEEVSATTDSAGELSFSNGSSIRVGTSLRSGTYQYLHISEFGKLCARYPERAEEVVTGSLNTVAPGQFVYIESTADGSYGRFYEMCKTAQANNELTQMDYKFFFFPWYNHPDYVLHEDVSIPEHQAKYFNELETALNVTIPQEKKAWYVKKSDEQRRKMKQEYPSTPNEAFEQISEYAVYGKEIGDAREEGRILSIPVNPSLPVDLFLDIGKSTKAETTSVWFMQESDPWFNFIDYYQSALQTVGGYVKDIKNKGYNIGRWFIPHDADTQKDYDIQTFKKRLIGAGVPQQNIVVVAMTPEVRIGIDQMKEKFPACRFDETKCNEGIVALSAYKYEWNEKLAIMGSPVHNWASHPADAIRQFAQGYYSARRPQTAPIVMNGDFNIF